MLGVPGDIVIRAIVDETGNTHCGFSEAELVSGWESLRGWVAGAPQPSPTDIQNTCLFLEGLGLGGPCRIDPSYAALHQRCTASSPFIDFRGRARDGSTRGNQRANVPR